MSDRNEERRPLVNQVNANPRWSSSVGSRRLRNNPSVRVESISRRSNEASGSEGTDVTSKSSRRSTSALSNSTRLACLCILTCVVFERIAFHGLIGNLELFLNKAPFLWNAFHAETVVFFFFGVAFLMAPFGGWLADSFFGRFKSIVLAFSVYMSGYFMLPFLAAENDSDHTVTETIKPHQTKLPDICAAPGNISIIPKKNSNPFKENCAWLIFIILFLIAVADGSAKAKLGPFGSDQLSGLPRGHHLSFFNWYYWCSNLGAFIGLGGLAFIEQQMNFQLGYIICTACLGVAIFIFVIGRFFYVCRPPDGSVLTNLIMIIHEAWKRKRQYRQQARLTTRRNSRIEDLAEDVDSPIMSTEESLSFLDYAKHQHGGIYDNALVNDVKKLKMILAVIAALIPYWLVYFQMQTTFLFQGLHMKLSITDIKPNNQSEMRNHTMPHKPEIVAAWFSLFDVLFVIILLPLFDRIIYPWMARSGFPFSFAKRIVLGMLFSIAAVVIAGVVEMYRLEAFWPFDDYPCKNACIAQIISRTEFQAADMSVFWQIPQYALIGISEVFASVACLQFAVSMAPKSMKALITGLFYTFCGIGSLLGSAIPYILFTTKTWFFSMDYGNINCRLPCTNENEKTFHHSCHLDYYFFLLGGIEAFGLLIFLYVSYKFGLNRDNLLAYNRPPGGRGRHVQRRSSPSSPH